MRILLVLILLTGTCWAKDSSDKPFFTDNSPFVSDPTCVNPQYIEFESGCINDTKTKIAVGTVIEKDEIKTLQDKVDKIAAMELWNHNAIVLICKKIGCGE
jgi:hypothetical protein